MAILVTGANGQLGRALQKLLPDGVFTDSDSLNIADEQAVNSFDLSRFEAVINAAAYTNVDGCETEPGTNLAWQVNSQAVANLAMATRVSQIPLVSVSTDYVFDGTSSKPYQEADPIRPLNMYGATKAAGEFASRLNANHYLVRTSWLYGDGHNFVRTMLDLSRTKKELTVVSDQIGRPTSATDLAQALLELLKTKAEPGIYHFSNSGRPVSWAYFARAIFKEAKLDCQVRDTSTEEHYQNVTTPYAKRPLYSVFSLNKIEKAGINLTDWQTSLATYIGQEPKNGRS
jgi:dTDP-4-dehydrorhamnose reductase